MTINQSKFILLSVFLVLQLQHLACQQEGFHRPNNEATQRLTINIDNCEGQSEKYLDLAKDQLSERFAKAEIYYKNITKDLKHHNLQVDIIGNKDKQKAELDLTNVLTKKAKLRLLTAVRNTDQDIVKEITAIIAKENLQGIFELNGKSQNRLPESILGTCSIHDFEKVKAIFDKYSSELTINIWWQNTNWSGQDAEVMSLFASRKNHLRTITEKDIIMSAADSDIYTGAMVVNLELSPAAAVVFEKMTTHAAADNSRAILIVIDEWVISAPQVMSPIPGGRLNISGGFTLGEAHDLALLLQPNRLPCDMTLISQEKI